MESFTITANPGTDIWRKPPKTDIFNAPTSHTQTRPLSSFVSARLTFSACWTTQYDQAGLLLSFFPSATSPPGASTSSSSKGPTPKWLKTGIELYNSIPRISTVACDVWADWSVAPVTATTAPTVGTVSGNNSAEPPTTIELKKQNSDSYGDSLWVYQILPGDENGAAEVRVPLREVTWVFAGLEGKGRGEGWDVRVEAFAARPKGDEGEGGPLEVGFEGMEVVWVD